MDLTNAEVDQLQGRAEVAEQERDALAESYNSLRGQLYALADSYDSTDYVSADTVRQEIKSLLDSE